MIEFSVELEVRHLSASEVLGDLIDDLLEKLEAHAAVTSYDSTTLSVKMNVEAETPSDAIALAQQMILSSMVDVSIPFRLPPVRLQAETVLALDHRLAESNAPDVIGVAELAALLDVSKQRASELARKHNFPKPVSILASGPIWRLSSVLRYSADWSRQPGRPKKVREPAAYFEPATMRSRVLLLAPSAVAIEGREETEILDAFEPQPFYRLAAHETFENLVLEDELLPSSAHSKLTETASTVRENRELVNTH